MHPCECGHESHSGRCGKTRQGCPCHEYTPAERARIVLLPKEGNSYYQGIRPTLVMPPGGGR